VLPLLLCAAAAWGAASAVLLRQGGDTPAPPSRTVVLVSFDGLRWDDPERAGAAAFGRMRREGVSAEGLVPPFPASTFPAHATLATGVHPDRHGIVANRFLDRERGLFSKEEDPSWLLSEPIWVTAERQGVRAAVHQWILSHGPWRGRAASIQVPFSPGQTDRGRVDAVIDWLDRPKETRPRLILQYLQGVDHTAHRTGPATAEVDAAVRSADRLVARLLDAAARSDGEVTLIVVSDHGMAGAARILRLDRLLSGEAGRVRVFSSGGSAHLYCPDRPACRAAEERLGEIPGLLLFRGDALPPAWRCMLPGRTGDLVVAAPAGHLLLERAPQGSAAGGGAHGHAPEERDMWGVFYAWGSGVRPGARVGRIDSVDVVPLVCRLLGISPPDRIDGRLRPELLTVE
jgi:predicted AlkP superfamily pyrophosphatase or phosphodiesterase